MTPAQFRDAVTILYGRNIMQASAELGVRHDKIARLCEGCDRIYDVTRTVITRKLREKRNAAAALLKQIDEAGA